MPSNISLSDRVRKFFRNSNIGYTLASVFIGFLVGAVILAIAGFNPLEAYSVMIKGVFSRPSYIAWTIIRATPLIITGLSIAFAFKTGLFNIGAEGQFIVGAMTAAAAGYFIKLPAIIHIPVVIILAMTAAGIYGGFAGYLKAKHGVHEVISTIMLNWIALYLNNYIVRLEGFKRATTQKSFDIQPTSSIIILEQWKRSEIGKAWLNNHEFWKDVFRTPLNFGIVGAIILAIIIWYVLNKTTLGYELKAVGFNKHAAEYGGINVQKSIIVSMLMAGALAGAAGAFHVMGESKSIASLAAMEGYGFDGIAVALIGGSTPLGAIFSGFLFGGLKYGGTKIQPALGAPSEVISIVIGTIVFFIAIPRAIKYIIEKLPKKRGAKNV